MSSAGHGLYCCNVFKLEYMEELDQWDLLELFHPHEVTITKNYQGLHKLSHVLSEFQHIRSGY